MLCSVPDGRVLLGLAAGHGPDLPGDLLENSSVALVSTHFPELDLKRADRWSEVGGFTADGLPLVGQLPGMEQAYFAVGFNGQGLNWAFVAADRLVKTILDEGELGVLSADRLRSVEAY